MINMEDLQKILKLVLLTGNLKNSKPVSLLIVSKSGNGKTELIKSFSKKSCAFVTDITYFGLLNLLQKDSKIKHLIIPDFIKITQKKRATADNFVSFLNALTEEGVNEVRIHNNSVDLKGKTLGLITATTKESFNQKKKVWGSFGFVQRMLFVSYDYKDETIEMIMQSINREEYIKDVQEKVVTLGKDIKTEEKFNRQLNQFVNKNFRSLKHLQALAKANAMLRKSNKVEQQDINEVIRLTKFMNLEYTKI